MRSRADVIIYALWFRFTNYNIMANNFISIDRYKFLHVLAAIAMMQILSAAAFGQPQPRERILINDNWKFYRYASLTQADSLKYDVRPSVESYNDNKAADSKPTEAVGIAVQQASLKPWVLPSGNGFIKDAAKHHVRPAGNPGGTFPFVQQQFDDGSWEQVNLPHDWAIKGPFYESDNPEIGGGMGRLPVHGVAWYRKKIDIPLSDKGRSIFLDIDGAMSYAIVWVNGQLAGGWPYGYTSFRLDLTPYIKFGAVNQLAIRLDNPPASSRWYPGAGIYRNVWLTKTQPVHIAQWGTTISTRNITNRSAVIDLRLMIDNQSKYPATVTTKTDFFIIDINSRKTGKPVATLRSAELKIGAGQTGEVKSAATIANPRLWGPPPSQTPHRYVAVTTIFSNGKTVDIYETTFGIRDVRFDPNNGLIVNGEKIIIKGANQHHDLGALGAAFNASAAERQLEMLKEMGCNAIRMSHNPPATELLELADKMGFLVMDEIYDSWERKKTPLDFHLVFPDWQEQDLRAMIRRDKNHPAVIVWSIGNEVGEQYTGQAGAKVAQRLYDIAKDEDPTRPITTAMNYAKPDMPLPTVVDVISLNYQGEGIRWGGAYAGMQGITTPPLFPAFHQKFPAKMIVSGENASALSSRGEYLFPVFEGNSAPVKEGQGGDSAARQVSAYELYSVAFGASADKVFATLDQHGYVAGGFVWTGWDHLGEPTPYYSSRSSYCGIIDLAGFKKDRFYLYQSYWRQAFPMAHIFPHWTWPQRAGLVTPVHVFTSGDEAELFLNGRSLGRKKKAQYEYRLRWDDVKYVPGQLKVIAYKNGRQWANDSVQTAGDAYKLTLSTDRSIIAADGTELSFITVRIEDKNGILVPMASNSVKFSVEGPAEVIATDNGDATNMQSFVSPERRAFNGLCLAIIRGKKGKSGVVKVKAEADGLQPANIVIRLIVLVNGHAL